MSKIVSQQFANITSITFNNPDKHNAIDDNFIDQFNVAFEVAKGDNDTKVIIIKAAGKNFSAGADLNWMQKMAGFNEEENTADALRLAEMMHSIYSCHKPTIAMVHGATFGGGLGIIAACDIAIAASDATFCFSEVKLGLIPAVISPYVIAAIGAKAAKWLFLTAEQFTAERALQLNLIQYMHESADLENLTWSLAKKIAKYPTSATAAAKELVTQVSDLAIGDKSMQLTAELIAKSRASKEAQQAISAFLHKHKPK